MHYIFYDQDNIPHELKSPEDFLKYIKTGQLGKKRQLYDTETGSLAKAEGNVHFENARKDFDARQEQEKISKSVKLSQPPKKKSPAAMLIIGILVLFLGVAAALFVGLNESANHEIEIPIDAPDTRDFTLIENILSLKYEYPEGEIDYSELTAFFEKQEKELRKEYEKLDNDFYKDFDSLVELNALASIENITNNKEIIEAHKKNNLEARNKIRKIMDKAFARNLRMISKYSSDAGEKISTFSKARLEKGYSDFNIFLNYQDKVYETLISTYDFMRVIFNKYKVTENSYVFESDALTEQYNSYFNTFKKDYRNLLDSKSKIDSIGFFNLTELEVLTY